MNWTKLNDFNMNFLANHSQAIYTNLIGHSVNKQKRTYARTMEHPYTPAYTPYVLISLRPHSPAAFYRTN